jgi:hypothetical protein
MTEAERKWVLDTMDGDRQTSLYAAAGMSVPIESMPHKFENDLEKEWYLEMIEDLKREKEEWAKKGIKIMWEIPFM